MFSMGIVFKESEWRCVNVAVVWSAPFERYGLAAASGAPVRYSQLSLGRE